MTLLFKEIKPNRFRYSAFRLEIAKAINKVVKEVKQDYEKTTETWEHKPVFTAVTQLSPPTALVETDDEIYGYVDRGTEPHPIFAGAYTGKSDKKVLAFSSDFVPKTTPGVIGSGSGMRGPVDTFTPYVQHPGTKARGFSKAIKEKWETRFRTRMEQAMKDAAQASGHGL